MQVYGNFHMRRCILLNITGTAAKNSPSCPHLLYRCGVSRGGTLSRAVSRKPAMNLTITQRSGLARSTLGDYPAPLVPVPTLYLCCDSVRVSIWPSTPCHCWPNVTNVRQAMGWRLATVQICGWMDHADGRPANTSLPTRLHPRRSLYQAQSNLISNF